MRYFCLRTNEISFRVYLLSSFYIRDRAFGEGAVLFCYAKKNRKKYTHTPTPPVLSPTGEEAVGSKASERFGYAKKNRKKLYSYPHSSRPLPHGRGSCRL